MRLLLFGRFQFPEGVDLQLHCLVRPLLFGRVLFPEGVDLQLHGLVRFAQCVDLQLDRFVRTAALLPRKAFPLSCFGHDRVSLRTPCCSRGSTQLPQMRLLSP
ncbi:hypothetical protein C1I97_34820 [Streptomyces sp. NTH33]|nr:hypothetical protein C1I97_34820 [Streptomyces sp. NTH33]